MTIDDENNLDIPGRRGTPRRLVRVGWGKSRSFTCPARAESAPDPSGQGSRAAGDDLEAPARRRTTELVAANARLAAANEELERARDSAEAGNRAKREFLVRISRDLRSPLGTVLGFSELMARDETLTAAQCEMARTIRRASEQLVDLVDEVSEASSQDCAPQRTMSMPPRLERGRALGPEELARAPRWLLNALYRATIEGDIDQILELACSLEDSVPSRELAAMARAYEYEELSDLIRAALEQR